ncbi:MAG: NEW3 domain-containing protein [Acidobacteriota bacterium]|jgi:LmbE family N-acetylglucosaminyl deacetylase|nr:NEW3 domain-containing protein [Acidobacteriota bacterium]
MKKSNFKIIISALVLFSIFHFPFSIKSQVRPTYDVGAVGLGQMLKRLQTTASVMHTGAHPDDEDSGLLAYLARREQARTVYLSLNRGDGGQNVLGEELFEPLGVIRTEELLQARRLDGGEQLFTRVMDYGFSKRRAEAAGIWGEKLTLGDMVRAIRLYRPLVIISRFSGTPADGHGQHQLAGYLTPQAFKAAADPNMFPEQLKEGLTTWQAKKLYISQGFRPSQDNVPTLILNTGVYDPLLGRSYFEVAMEGRSQHKSQEMGVIEARGKRTSGMRLLETIGKKVENETSVFDGLDTSIKGIAVLTNNSDKSFMNKLADLQTTAEMALKQYNLYRPQEIVPILAKGYKQAVDAENSTSNADSKFILRQKQAEFAKALQMASGVVVDVLSDTDKLVGGNSTNVSVKVFAPDNTGVKVKNILLNVPSGWKSETAAEPKPSGNVFRFFTEDALSAAFFKITASENAALTQPYWLEKPRNANFTFDWSAEDAAKNMPFQEPLVTADVKMEIGGQEISVNKKVEYRYADDIRGELRRDLNIVPAVTIGLESNLLIAPTAARVSDYKVTMTITNNMPDAVSGKAQIVLPAGWKLSPAASDFSLKRTGDKATLSFNVTIPANTKPGDYQLTANAVINGKKYDRQVLEIAYPHIQTHRIYSRSDITAQVLDLKVAPVKVGYVMGSGDKVPDAIKRLGLDVKMLDEKDLSTGNLNQYDTIVIGIRASQVRPDFVANNEHLLDFVKNGGTMIVQYQQSEYIRNNLPPFPAKMEGNIRTVDETAKVTILEPNNEAFNFPNKITQADFDNWVQERHLYSLTDWDAKYTPLLESHDEDEAESKGGMLYAKIGKGKYIYTSYSWFRQLPKGVPGAYRIFANMLSLPKAK